MRGRGGGCVEGGRKSDKSATTKIIPTGFSFFLLTMGFKRRARRLAEAQHLCVESKGLLQVPTLPGYMVETPDGQGRQGNPNHTWLVHHHAFVLFVFSSRAALWGGHGACNFQWARRKDTPHQLELITACHCVLRGIKMV
jgi:hypothetical protein